MGCVIQLSYVPGECHENHNKYNPFWPGFFLTKLDALLASDVLWEDSRRRS